MATYDFPILPTIVEAVRAMDRNPELKPLRRAKVSRWHGLNADTLRIIWKAKPTSREVATVADAWQALRPRGVIEHCWG
jgi:hypothetical protein